ncbi:MAG: glycosyltransferase family 2 protein [Bacilli bacterium]|nr:glycosyltransferase family 2 protein [Bacilli bacterium]MDD4733542.1 glycosyltransferase family 2 protein [Bacilli bacterium]
MDELISIIIPVYNAERFLNETIESIQNQTYKNFEVIFVDDCSTDNSVKIIKKNMKDDKRIKLFKNPVNSGPAISRNFGVQKAKGEYLCFLDADDLWDNDKLEKQLLFMQKNNCAFSYTSYEFADENGIPNGKKVIAKEKMTYNQALKKTIISTITVMFDLKKIEKELLLMPNLIYVEDTATWWQILRNGYVAYGIPNVFSYYRRISNSHSSNKIRTLKKLWHLYRSVEKLNIFYAGYCFSLKNINAIRRRI